MLFSLFSQDRNMLGVLCNRKPDAVANLVGNADNPQLKGTVKFFGLPDGTVVLHEIHNLPDTKTCFFAMHVHEGDDCGNNFADTGEHYSKEVCEHPLHTGDLTNILSGGGYSFGAIFTNRFKVSDVLDRTVIIHSSPDDFRSQPSGDSGQKIACGVIKSVVR